MYDEMSKGKRKRGRREGKKRIEVWDKKSGKNGKRTNSRAVKGNTIKIASSINYSIQVSFEVTESCVILC